MRATVKQASSELGANQIGATQLGKTPEPEPAKTRRAGVPAFSVDNSEARMAWTSQAMCRTIDPDELFVRGAAQRKAANICRHCPVMMECAADALDNKVEFGVWGGMTERQRRALLKQHPDVTSWGEFFEAHRRRQAVG